MRSIWNSRLLIGALAASATLLAAAAVSPAATPSRAPQYGTNIIGGSPAPAGEWPAMTALLFRSVPNAYNAKFCGATLITSHWLVTAAHCVVDRADRVADPGAIEAAIGLLNLSEITPAQRKAIDRIVVHPGYTSSRFSNDIALLRLVEDATQTPRPIVSPSDEKMVVEGKAAMIAGWGCAVTPSGSEPSCPAGGYPNALNQAAIQIDSNDDCARLWGRIRPGDSPVRRSRVSQCVLWGQRRPLDDCRFRCHQGDCRGNELR